MKERITLETGEVVDVYSYGVGTTLPKSARLFYNLGRYTGPQTPDNWKLSNKFKEVVDVTSFMKDPRMRSVEHIAHHNFKYSV